MNKWKYYDWDSKNAVPLKIAFELMCMRLLFVCKTVKFQFCFFVLIALYFLMAWSRGYGMWAFYNVFVLLLFLIWCAILLAKVFFVTSFHVDERGEELEYKWRRCTTIWDFIRACVLYTTNAACHWERERVRDLNEFVGRLMGRRTEYNIALFRLKLHFTRSVISPLL